MHLTLKNYIQGVQDWSLSAQEVVKHYVKKAKKMNADLFAFVRFHDEYVDKHLDECATKELKSAPIGIKDIILTEGYISSCGSKMLENYISPYTATCITNLENHGWLIIGKTNMDEFAMGSSTETSYFGKTYNIYGKDRVPGGSSGWSATAVAADMCIAALGTDTGWSIRQPAALCGIVGMKPTYGMVSRYGVQSMASSLDQVGVLTKTVEDAEILLKAIAGFDPHDSQSNPRSDAFVISKSEKWNKKYKVAVPQEVIGAWLDPKIKKLFLDKVEQLRKQWYEIDEVAMPMLAFSVAIYYTLMPAELSTNLARFDGIRFGLQESTLGCKNIKEYYEKIRSEWFGEEAKRRILLGTFVLSSANYEWYYLKWQQARQEMQDEFDDFFQKYDFILTPTSPEVARKMGAKSDDPIKMYLSDMYTIPANMAWLPAISVPMGMVEDQGEMLPAGIQLMANKWEEDKLFGFGKVVEGLNK